MTNTNETRAQYLTRTATEPLVVIELARSEDELAQAQATYDQAEAERRTARRTAENSPGAKAAREAAKADPDAPGRYTRGGDRRGDRAAETYAARDPEVKRARNASDRARRALALAEARHSNSLAFAEAWVDSQV